MAARLAIRPNFVKNDPMTGASSFDPIPAAAQRRDAQFGSRQTFSRKVFIPVTRLCRDVCHYCTFAHPPRAGQAVYMSRV
jgi:FO synthase